jgi:hypothetical protein
MKRYGEAKKLFPTRVSLGTCGEVDGFPSSIARSELYKADMFTNGVNNHEMDLPIVRVSSAANLALTLTMHYYCKLQLKLLSP